MTMITSHLALGDQNDPARYQNEIDAVLCCADNVALFPGKPGHHLRLSNVSPADPTDIDEAFEFLDRQLAAGKLVLVYCQHGSSRSASVLCGYLARKTGKSMESILAAMKALRPQIAPSSIIFGALRP
jgi:predicted protein tyrosine phosphatase